jgi:hypothetical protein
MDKDIKEEYLKGLDPLFRDIVETLSGIIESVDKRLECDIKWNRLTYSLSGDYHHWIYGIAKTKKSINLIFHFGGIIDDKDEQFLVGESFLLRKLEYSTRNGIKDSVIRDFVAQAINRLEYFKENWKKLNK